MSERVKFFMSFRARLMLLLTSFVLLTIILVLTLDNWTRERANEEVETQSGEIKDAVNDGFSDFAVAIGLAIQNLSSERYLYKQIEAGEVKLPPTVEHIIVADKDGKVSDTTLPELDGGSIPVPEQEVIQQGSVDPVEGSVEIHGGKSKTYSIPFTSSKGLYWIVIVTTQQSIIQQIDTALLTLSDKSRELSNIRSLATGVLLLMALAIAVIIGWRFTQPIQKMASAARRVAAGNLDFRVDVDRRDEVGQLATTFNEMIDGLRSKRELEEKLNQAERSAAIGRLIQSVAHEIRNPLNVINLSIDHVASKYAPEDEARRSQLNRILSTIKDEVERLKRLVNDLLNYGRPTRLAVENVNMSTLFEETIALIGPQADEQGVKVTVEESEPAVEVRGDRERLKSCLSNLAINALQAMPTGGKLCARIEKTDGFVNISMSDTGVGISEEALGKIFEPYFSTKQTGFGLGLAVTKTIVEEHQGSIKVVSQPGVGTTFTVRLPAANA
ncbi:MAG TPA: ATP-binding protein [Blastocatellia bacterium]|nr:ATP-binding protein [Blastocatellia bacterium]